MRFLLAVALLAVALPAEAAKMCFVPYSQFEEMVKHVDLSVCPEPKMKQDEGFCRLAVDGDRVRVYRFRFMGDEACLEKIDTQPFDEFVKRFGTSYESE
jgi:hypothetical protein